MYSSLQLFVGSFAGLIGLIIGVIVSAASIEELKSGGKWFSWFLDVFFALIIGVAMYNYGPIIRVVGVVMALLLVSSFVGVQKLIFVAFIMQLMLIFFWQSQVYALFVGAFLLVGLLCGGVWSAYRQKVVKGGLFTKPVWKLLLHDCLLFVILPLANIVVLV